MRKPAAAVEACSSGDSTPQEATEIVAESRDEGTEEQSEDYTEIDGGGEDDEEDVVLFDPSEVTRQPCPEAQGCTAVVVLVVHSGTDGPQLICGNAGDSRAMLSRCGKCVDLSEDHKPEQPGETARIEKAGGFVKDMPGGPRVMGDLNLSRAMGDLRWK